MSDTTTTTPDVPVEAKQGHGFVKVSGLIVAIIGAIMLIGGPALGAGPDLRLGRADHGRGGRLEQRGQGRQPAPSPPSARR